MGRVCSVLILLFHGYISLSVNVPGKGDLPRDQPRTVICHFYYVLKSEPPLMWTHYSLSGVATSVYVRRCAYLLLVNLLSFDCLWAFLMLDHI